MFLRAASRGLAPLSTVSRASPVSQGVVREARRFLLPTDSAKRMLCKPGTNSVKIGIVGMPNIGKSTLFNCLSAQNVPAQNFPFCTIDPNNAVVEVPDPRMAWLTTAVKPNQTVPATLSITDIAGLVKGASEGKGLGNEFLANIGAVDAILHLVRVFPDSKSRAIEHVEGSVDPIRDLEIISHELLAKDHARVKQANERVQRLAGKAGVDPKRAAQAAAYPKALALIEAGTDVREGLFTEAEAEAISELGLLTAKPILYLMNSAPDAFLTGKVPNAARVREWISKRSPGAPSLIFSADWEADLMLMENAEERASYVADAVADSPRVKEGGDALMQAGEMSYIQRAALDAVPETQSMLPCIITAGYTALDLMQYFTVGDIEVRAWSIKRGTTAPQAAGVIHSDFEKNFICGDIYSYDDIRELGSEAEVKKAGKLKTQGKTYIMQDGDICHWKHAARK